MNRLKKNYFYLKASKSVSDERKTFPHKCSRDYLETKRIIFKIIHVFVLTNF